MPSIISAMTAPGKAGNDSASAINLKVMTRILEILAGILPATLKVLAMIL